MRSLPAARSLTVVSALTLLALVSISVGDVRPVSDTDDGSWHSQAGEIHTGKTAVTPAEPAPVPPLESPQGITGRALAVTVTRGPAHHVESAEARRISSTLILPEPPAPSFDGPTSYSRPAEGPGTPHSLRRSGASATEAGVLDTFDSFLFEDNPGFFIPPDPIGAAGPSHVVNVVNVSVRFHTKAGAVTFSDSLADFFTALSPLTATFDPKVIYDQHSGRFVIVTLERTDTADGAAANTSRILLAVSDDSDPNGTWHQIAIDAKETFFNPNAGGSVEHWADYPGFAVDDEGVYITNNMYTFGVRSFGGVRLWIVPKGVGTGGFYDGGVASANVLDPIVGPAVAVTLQPAQVFGSPPPSVGTWLAGYTGLTDGLDEFVQLIRVDNPVSSPSLAVEFVNAGDIEDFVTPPLPDAAQPLTETAIETNDRRALDAVWRDGSLWLAATIDPRVGDPDSGEATAHWFELATGVPSGSSLVDQGSIGGEDIAPGTHTFFPSLAVNAAGSVGIGFSAAGPSVFAGSYYTFRKPGDPAGAVAPTRLLRRGVDYYVRTFGTGRNRWGDYSGTVVDPVDGCFWVYNESALERGSPSAGNEDGRWGTAWGRFCPDLAICGNSAVEPGETCDPPGGTCGSDCSSCGDGAIDVGETCDPPGVPPGQGDECRVDCTYCGDLLLDAGEECDDGNGSDGDGCSATCELEGCGDGVVGPDETCDPPGQPAGQPDECRADCDYCGDGVVNGAMQLIANRGFESGLARWNLTDAGSAGTFLSTSGAPTPLSGFATAVNPLGGGGYAVSDSGGPGAQALSQSFSVPVSASAVALSFEMFVNDQNGAGAIIDPSGLDHTGAANQHARVDLLSSGSPPFDTGAGVLSNLYLGVDPGPLPNPYASYQFDITVAASPGGTYDLRFAGVANQFFLSQGVDNVSVEAQIPGTVEECDDGNNVNGDGCSADCLEEVACMTDPDCDDGDPCTDDICTAFGCSNPFNAAPCDDGDACTIGDTCDAGVCEGGAPVSCDDGNPCTDDACDPASGCFSTDNTAPCDDLNACTIGDTCGGGACQPGNSLLCNDGNSCTDDSCEPASGCLFTNNVAPCDDGDACTAGDACSDGMCVGGGPLACDDGNVCTDDSCDSVSGCMFTDNAAPCDDGDTCTAGDTCSAGTCEGGGPLACDDGNACTDDSCDSGSGCVFTDNTAPCDDGDACTTNDVCGSGLCQGSVLACDDGNVCTDDSCDSASGCMFTNNAAPCDDGDACTAGDSCSAGACVAGGPQACDDGNDCTDDSCDSGSGCVFADNTAPCDDGDACTIGDACSAGVCEGGGPLACDDGNVCTDDTCDSGSGCVFTDNTSPCDDGDACTDGDACSAGACIGGGPLACDDGNVCTDDTCDSGSGCVFTDNTAACDDGDACTIGDSCSAGVCEGSGPLACDDGNVCTDDTCDSGSGCVFADNTSPCDDGDACTIGDACSAGACIGGGPLACDDGNVCTDDTCDSGSGCVLTDNTSPCDDGDACTDGDVCSAGACIGGGPLACDDGNVCTDDTCDSGSGCVFADNTSPCDDGDACTIGDACSAGACIGGGPLACDDGNVCTDDTCDSGSGCVLTDNTAACDDGDACTDGDVCSAGACIGGGPLACDDGNVCTDDTCDSGSGCVFTDNTAACDDGDACTIGDSCSAGVCEGSGPLACDDGNVCTDDTCDSGSGCVFADNTSPCDDGDACTIGDACSAGACIGGGPLACDDGNVCTDDTCDSGSGCVFTDNAGPCDDSDACTIDDTCNAGVCEGGGPPVCDDGNLCTDDTCDSGSGCVFTNNTAACDDGDACTIGDSCSAGVCEGSGPLACDDGNVCTDDTCDSGSGCVFADNTAPCDDSDACTMGDTCGNGVCVGSPGPPPGEVVGLLFGSDKQTLSWTAVIGPVVYDTLRTGDATDFDGPAVCIESDDGADTTASDVEEPGAGVVFHYLPRAENDCPMGTGSLGTDSAATERTGRECEMTGLARDSGADLIPLGARLD